MAKKESNLPAPVENKALATANALGIVVSEEAPDFIETGTKGTEHITKDDVQMPRLAVAQKMHKEVDPSEDKYIDGLKVGDFFNTVTKEIYGPGPLYFMILRADPPRYIEFKPLSEGGGVVDFNVPPDDPRTKWNGQKKPVATKYYDYVVMLLREPAEKGGEVRLEEVAISLKSTAIKAAKHLNTLFKTRKKKGQPVPIYSGVYSVLSVDDENPKGKFKNFQFDNAGWPGDNTLALIAADKSANWANKEIKVDREQTEEGEDDPEM